MTDVALEKSVHDIGENYVLAPTIKSLCTEWPGLVCPNSGT